MEPNRLGRSTILLKAFVRSHDLIRKVCIFSRSCFNPRRFAGQRDRRVLGFSHDHFVSFARRACRALADRRHIRDQPRRQDRSGGRDGRSLRRPLPRARRIRAVRALWRDGRRRGRRAARHGGCDRAGPHPRGVADRDGAGRGAQCARLRAVGSGCQAGRPAGIRTCGTSRSTTSHHRVHHFAGGA